MIALLATTAGWEIGWPAMKVLVGEWPPLLARGVCGCIAAACLLAVCLARGERVRLSWQGFRRLALLAVLNVTSWMGCTALCLSWLSAGEGALITYTMPIWAMLLAALLLGEELTIRRLTAIVLGLCGSAVIVTSQGVAIGVTKLPGVGLALVAAASFALGSVLSKRMTMPVAPLPCTTWQVGLGCLPLLVAGLLMDQHRQAGLDNRGWLALAYMSLGPMAACYLTWYRALRELPATTASLGTLLVPIVGILSSSLLIGERVTLIELAAAALTLGGVCLALVPRGRSPV